MNKIKVKVIIETKNDQKVEEEDADICKPPLKLNSSFVFCVCIIF